MIINPRLLYYRESHFKANAGCDYLFKNTLRSHHNSFLSKKLTISLKQFLKYSLLKLKT